MITVEKKHPLAIRWNHWINFPVILIMVWSGLLIYWANDVYLLPGSWLEAVGMGAKLGQGMSWHFPFAVVFGVNGVCYVAFLFFSGQWRYLFPEKHSIKDALVVFLHDLKIYKGELPKQVKYNGAQRFAYTGMLLLGFAALLSGLAIYKPVQLSWLVAALGGYKAARLEHFLVTVGFVAFFFIHIAQVIRAGWNNFRAMITGTERVLEKPNAE